jgi:DNA-binding response OmpR family regulator
MPCSWPALRIARTEVERAMPRVLVVDDEPNHVRVLSIGLKIEGFDVTTAENAASALASLDVVPADLAIVDLMMPGTSGIELARLVRERHPATRILLTSAYHLSERQLLRADCGAVGFVPKPYDLAELARFIHAKLAAPGSVSSVERMGTCDDGEDRAPAIAI